ncbi:MAG: hypothetical protein H7067_03685 [Burkholderiales bacterium]|nr:hypothetical protein [Opitutaceae bacterium]
MVSLEPYVWEAVKAHRKTSPKPVAYACLSVLQGMSFSGINQHYSEIGAVAVELLRTLMMIPTAPNIQTLTADYADGRRYQILSDDICAICG